MTHIYRSLRIGAAALGCAIAFATPGPAQEFPTIERGLKPERSFELGRIDQVRLFNGGLTMTIPLGQTYSVGVGAELSYRLALTYSSQVWDYIQAEAPPFYSPPIVTQAWPGRVFNAGLGWRLSLGEYWDPTVFGPGRCGDCYVGPDGAQHPFYQTLHPDVADDSANTLYTRDGTYLRLRRAAREIDFPNGEIHRFDAQGRLIQIRDRQGNTITVTHGANAWTIDDGLRTHTVNLVDVAHYGKAVGSVVLATFGGGSAHYTFEYAQPVVTRSCVDTDPTTSSTLQLPLLVKVTLPDGSSYAMPETSYDLSGASRFCDALDYVPATQGLLGEITLPTRGRIRWTYQAFNFPVPIEGDNGEDPLWLQKTTAVRTRALVAADGTPAGTWTYSQALPGGQNAVESITRVSSPLGDRTDHYFTVGRKPDPLYGLPISPVESAPGRPDLLRSVKVYDCDGGGAGCVLERTTYLKYRTDSPFPGGPEFNPRVEAEYVRFHDDANRWIATDRSSFDGLGHYRIETISSNLPGGADHTERTNFNPTRGTYPGTFVMPTTATPWVLGTYDFRDRQEGSQTLRTDFCFEPASGFLKRVRKRKSTGGGTGANDLVSVSTRDAGAQQIVRQYYGGDLTPVGTGADLCSLGLGTDSFRIRDTYQFGVLARSEYLTTANGVVLTTVDRTVDRNTGAVSVERDSAAVATTYVYDNLGRLTQKKPAFDAWTLFTYTAPIGTNAALRVRAYENGAFTTWITNEQIVFDDFGRVMRERRRMPGAFWARRTTLYDAMSRVTDVSAWQADTDNTAWTRYRDYDPFGRPGYVDPPEGPSHRRSFTYTGARVVARTTSVGTAIAGGTVVESPVTVVERYDRHGRLHQVVDGGGSTVTYGYDPAGNLTQVARSGQTRAFAYDGRGFLTSEVLPEKGVAGNGQVTYARYDALGHLGRRNDGPMSVDHEYDRAGRLTRTRVPGGADLKVFTYGTGTAAGDRSRGKVKTAERYNYVVVSGTPYTVRLRETYTYGGRSGRVSRRDIQTWVDGGAFESFTQSWNGHDALGNVTSLSFPQCTHAECTAPTPRNVGFGYDHGQLRSVSGWATTIAYWHSGLTRSVAHTNGVTVDQTRDPWWRPLPRAIATSGALDASGTASANWSSGNYVFDGARNVTQIGSGRYVYDPRSRLISAAFTTSLYGGAAADRTQTYVYDAYGNRLSSTTNGVTINTLISSSTNRMTGWVAYDAAGNQTTWNGKIYEYDRFGNMWRMRAGAIERIFLYTAADERLWTYHVGDNRSTWTLRDLDGRVLREYDNQAGSWSVHRDYVYRGDKLLGAVTPTGKRHFHLDHLGTPRLITDTAGRQVARYVYYPYGELAAGSVTDGERMRFTGHERDLNGTTGSQPEADDLDYLHARFYNPQHARFLSVDPGRDADPRDTQSWNLYLYARDNPMRFVDPNGEAVETPWDGFNVGLGFVSLVDNVRNGHWGWAAVDFGGLVYDVFATAAPGVPGGAGSVIKAARFGDAAVDAARLAGRVDDVADAARAGRAVIGHFPEYIKLADDLGAKRFDVPMDVWERMSGVERWAANQKFLDRLIARGDEVLLATPIERIRPGSVAQREVNYLLDHGYMLATDGSKLVPIPGHK